jgi:AmiR/NasT family two-component response regulator
MGADGIAEGIAYRKLRRRTSERRVTLRVVAGEIVSGTSNG